MIELTVLNYLKAHTNINVPVYMEIPEKPPTSFLLIKKEGAGLTNKINACTLTIQAYADTLYKAVSLSEVVKNVMIDLGETSNLVYGVHLGGENNNTDTTNKRYRYETNWNLYF